MKTKISKNFTLEEMVRSSTATIYKIDNTPPPAAVANITLLCLNVLDKVVALTGRPVFVTSGFRCLQLNTKKKGSKNSQHLAGTVSGKQEAAADIHDNELTTEQFYLLIKKSNIKFDQLIQEFDGWVHISWCPFPRGQCLRATKNAENGTVYTVDQA